MWQFQPCTMELRQFMMANSEAQNIIICELCDNSNPVRWYCINCLENLCDSCKIVHERGKLTKRHEVVSKPDYYRLHGKKRLEGKCEFHNNNMCTVYCPCCNDLLCTTCVTENHLGHALKEIEIVLLWRKFTIYNCQIYQINNVRLQTWERNTRKINTV
jgi:hypothetical protein